MYENITEILDRLGIDYNDHNNRISFKCPLHESDTDDSLSIIKHGRSRDGVWRCWTRSCESEHGYGILNLIKALLSKKLNKIVSKEETLAFISDICQIEQVDENLEQFIKYTQTKLESEPNISVERKLIRSKLIIPSDYYLQRGYDRTILDKYDIGFCGTKKKKMYMRTVVPVYDINYTKMIGCAGRSINKQCKQCNKYHIGKCPETKIEKYFASKWINSNGFYCGNYLYNLWFAKKYINELGYVILVEGPGDVWKLESAGIHNSLAIFGDKLTESQQDILNSLTIFNLVIMTDNDDAGNKARKNIEHQCKRYFNIIHKTTKTKDSGDMTTEDLQKLLKDI